MKRIAGYGFVTVALAMFGWLALSPAESASFDCGKASHLLEKTICASPKLSRLDEEVASLYRQKLGIVFDRANFRGQQRDWQQILRTRCAKKCDAARVEADYVQQRAFLRDFAEESYEASYKTADVATLKMTHLTSGQFDFAISRDLDQDQLCKLPAGDGEAGAVVGMATPAKAKWTSGACTIDFGFTRDTTGHVTRIDLTASPGCKRYCKPNQGLSDVYLPANNWVAGNQ